MRNAIKSALIWALSGLSLLAGLMALYLWSYFLIVFLPIIGRFLMADL